MSVTAGFSEVAEAAQGTFQTAQEATNLHMLAFEAAVVKRFSQKGSREMVESGVNRSKLPPRVMPLVQNDNGQQYMH